MEYVDQIIELEGPYGIIGRTVVVHEGEDDFGLGEFEDSKTTGHSGDRLGCCIIGFSEPFW